MNSHTTNRRKSKSLPVEQEQQTNHRSCCGVKGCTQQTVIDQESGESFLDSGFDKLDIGAAMYDDELSFDTEYINIDYILDSLWKRLQF